MTITLTRTGFSFTFPEVLELVLELVLVLAERVWVGPDELESNQEPELLPLRPRPLRSLRLHLLLPFHRLRLVHG